MLYDTPLEDILFLDIETVPEVYRYRELDEQMQKLFSRKTAYRQTDEKGPEELYEEAAFWAEFGKVVTAAFGVMKRGEDGQYTLTVHSVASDNEKELLEQIADILNKFDRIVQKRGRKAFLCAHNGKEFDFPFLARRMLINRVKLPDILKVQGKKPWETSFCDTLQLWRFGDFKHYTSLELLAVILGIPTPKDDIEGKDVPRIYYEEKDLERIEKYCRKDVITLTNIFLRMREEEPLPPERVKGVDS
ncbi:MAG: 3'-5' exonuclease [Chlorobi bacterium]|nr:3'-5' exonuclease [Chlorobiota bacterium]